MLEEVVITGPMVVVDEMLKGKRGSPEEEIELVAEVVVFIGVGEVAGV